MFHFIKEAFKVYINNVLIAFIDIPARLLYALQSVFAGAEAITVFLKFIQNRGVR